MERSLGLLVLERESASTREGSPKSFVICSWYGRVGALQALRPIESADEVMFTTNYSYDLIEVWANPGFYSKNPNRPDNLFVDAENAEIVRKVLPQDAAIVIKTKFRVNNKYYFDCLGRFSAVASEDNLGVLEKMISSGANINYRHPKGGTLVHLAAERGGENLIRILIRHGMDLNATRIDGSTPFLVALMSGNEAVVKALIENGASVNGKMTDGSTALHFAIKSGMPETVKMLLDKGFDVNSKAAKGCTPLHLAIKSKLPEVVETLLGRGASVNAKDSSGSTPLHVAVESKLPDVVKRLIEKGADVNAKTKKGWTPLHAAAEFGDEELKYDFALDSSRIISILLDKGSEIDPIGSGGKYTAGMTPLLVALKNDQRYSANTLMDTHGANHKAVCVQGRNALYFAVYWSNEGMIKHLLRLKPDVNRPENKKAFYLAFCKEDVVDISEKLRWCKVIGINETGGCTSVVEDFIDAGFSIEPEEACVPDVLYGAIRKRFFWLVKRLVEYGVDLNQKHLFQLIEFGGNTPRRPAFLKYETTPIHVACRYAPTKIVKFLLEHGADPTVGCGPDSIFTPIAAAVDSGNSNIVDLLVSKGIVVHDRPELLRAALKRRYHNVMKVLLENGCALDWTEEKALAHVIPRSCDLCVRILMKYGASFDYCDIVLDKEYHDNDLFYAEVTSPDFLKSLLAYGFTDIDSPAETFLIKLLDKCELKPEPFSDSEVSSDDDDSFSGPHDEERNCTKDKLGKIILKHVASLRAAGKTVGKILDQFKNILNFETLIESCQKELEVMKERLIDGTNILVFDVLTTDTVPRWFKSRSFRTAVEKMKITSSAKREFPLYGKVIESRINQVLWKYEFFIKGIKGFNRLSVQLPTLPHDVKIRIVDLLDRQDMINLDICFKPKKSKIEGHSNLDMLDYDDWSF